MYEAIKAFEKIGYELMYRSDTCIIFEHNNYTSYEKITFTYRDGSPIVRKEKQSGRLLAFYYEELLACKKVLKVLGKNESHKKRSEPYVKYERENIEDLKRRGYLDSDYLHPDSQEYENKRSARAMERAEERRYEGLPWEAAKRLREEDGYERMRRREETEACVERIHYREWENDVRHRMGIGVDYWK